MEVLFIVGPIVGFLLFVASRDIWRNRVRGKTLQKDEDGRWVWIDESGNKTIDNYYTPDTYGGSGLSDHSADVGHGDH